MGGSNELPESFGMENATVIQSKVSEGGLDQVGNAKVFVLVRDVDNSKALGAELRRHAYIVFLAATALELEINLSKEGGDVIIMDSVLPDVDGFAVLKKLRSAMGHIGIIVISETDEEIDRIVALELGADDCVSKSCSMRELNARVRSVLRRLSDHRGHLTSRPKSPETVSSGALIRFGGWALDPTGRKLIAPSGEDLPITAAEYNILITLLKDPGVVKDRTSLRGRVANGEFLIDRRSMDAIVSRLRRKLGAYDDQPLIETVRGSGYRLIPRVRGDQEF